MVVFLAQKDGVSHSSLPLTRRVAQEPCLAASLMPVVSCDLTCQNLPKVFATDASLGRGAVCSAEVSSEVRKSCWLNGDRNGEGGGPRRGSSRPCTSRRPPTFRGRHRSGPQTPLPSIPFVIDLLVEICGGAGVVSKAARSLGLSICVPIDVSLSPHFDILQPEFGTWLHSMIKAQGSPCPAPPSALQPTRVLEATRSRRALTGAIPGSCWGIGLPSDASSFSSLPGASASRLSSSSLVAQSLRGQSGGDALLHSRMCLIGSLPAVWMARPIGRSFGSWAAISALGDFRGAVAGTTRM